MSSVSSIESVLVQMRQLAAAAGVQDSKPVVAQGGFAVELQKALQSVSGAEMNARRMQQDFILGNKDVHLSDVMIELQKANIGFQSAVQVRNKLVQAYQTIASMPI